MYTDRIHFDLTLEQIGVGFVADGDKDTIAIKCFCLVGLKVVQSDTRDALRCRPQNFFNSSVPDELNLVIANALSCMIFDARSLSRR